VEPRLTHVVNPSATPPVGWGLYRFRHAPSDPPVITRGLRASISRARAAGLLDVSRLVVEALEVRRVGEQGVIRWADVMSLAQSDRWTPDPE
jgi:hypothetical protein